MLGDRLFKTIEDHSYDRLRRAFAWDLPQRFNMGIACSNDQAADDLALVIPQPAGASRRVTFGELARDSDRLSNFLRGAGIGSGDRVAIILPQSLEAGLAYLATFKLGGIAVPISVLYGPDAIRYRLSHSGVRALVTDRSGVEKVMAVSPDLPDLRKILVVGDGERDRDAGSIDLDEAIGSASPDRVDAGTAAHDPALLIYTSGTTGEPKGALHAHRFLYGSLPAVELAHWPLADSGGVFWTPADWSWVAALMDIVLPAWFLGLPVLATARSKFDPEWAFSVMSEHRVANAYLPPTALKMMRLVDEPVGTLHLHSVMTGGEALGSDLFDWGLDRFGVAIQETYGQTEANLTVGNAASFWPVRPGSMGRPYPGHDVRIEREDGSETDPGEPGEVVVRGPNPAMFLGYFEDPGATDEAFRNGALRSGDMARRDEEGYLWFEGRQDDLINSAGYRLGPVEIEQCLAQHPAVAMAGVIGVPDPERGQAIKAFIVLRDGNDPKPDLEDALRKHVREMLGAHQYPRSFDFVEELPLTTSGKIRRRDLRERDRDNDL